MPLLQPRLTSLFALWALLCLPAMASAQEDDGDGPQEAQILQAQQLSADGSAHYQAERFEAALQSFEAANRLVPHPNLEINIGRAYEKLNQPEQARLHCGIAMQAPEASVATREAARECVERVEPLLKPPTWTIRTVPEGAELRVDGELKGRTPWTGPIVPGRRQLDFSLTGYTPQTRTITSERGQEDQLSVVLSHEKVGGILVLDTLPQNASVKLNGEFIGNTPITGFTIEAGRHQLELAIPGYETQHLNVVINDGSLFQRTINLLTKEEHLQQASRPQWPAWTMLGVSVVSASVGAILGSYALSRRQEADKLARTSTLPEDGLRYDNLVSDMKTYRTVADVLYVTGGLSLVGGLTWILWPDSPQAKTHSQGGLSAGAQGGIAFEW